MKITGLDRESAQAFPPVMICRRLLPALAGALVALVALAAPAREAAHPHARTGTPPTALDRYIAAPDTNFTWKVAGSVRGEGGEAYFIDLTSQQWLTTNEVSQPLWRHWIILARPDDLQHDTALLFISGGRNGDNRPPRVNNDLINIARQTKSVVAELKMVPNQPLVFFNDRSEERRVGKECRSRWSPYH